MGKLIYEPVIHHFSHPHPLELSTFQQTGVGVESSCYGCKFKLSGWIYTCKTCNYSLHVSCSQAPQLIHHPADPNHPLPLLPHPPYQEGYFDCNACGRQGNGFSYHCGTCDLDIHVYCASMPLSLLHQAHQHPLNLIVFPPYQNKGFYCDICHNMGSNHWLYRCGLCEFDAHLACAGGSMDPSEQGETSQQCQLHGASGGAGAKARAAKKVLKVVVNGISVGLIGVPIASLATIGRQSDRNPTR